MSNEFNPAFDMPTTAVEAQAVIKAWGNPLNATFSSAKAAQAARLLKEALNTSETASWRENVEYLLKRCPHTIRVCEGGGPESLLDSLIVTFMKMEMIIEGKK